jgi:cyclophilin family peptidyl-prolyl cis-trans isomerase
MIRYAIAFLLLLVAVVLYLGDKKKRINLGKWDNIVTISLGILSLITLAFPEISSQSTTLQKSESVYIPIDGIFCKGTGTLIETERTLSHLRPESRDGYYQTSPPIIINTGACYEAVILTEKGQIRLGLFTEEAPLTVNNFIFLSTQGFYDDTTFHRVIYEFVAQGGDPTGTGSGGPGYCFQDEIESSIKFDKPGLVAMANQGLHSSPRCPYTNGSQFFITYVPTEWLNGNHTIFGEMVDGELVLKALTFRSSGENLDYSGDIIKRIEIYEFPN